MSAGRANKPVERLWAVHALGTVLRAPFLDRGRYHGDIGRANAGAAGADAPRTPEIDVSEDDLRAIAKRDYEGAVTTDLDQQAQAVGLFPNRRASANLTA